MTEEKVPYIDRNMKVTIREIAKAAKVSVATVSRVINKDTEYLVAPATKKRVLETIRAYRYVPDQTARNLSRKESQTLGVVVPFVHSIFSVDYYVKILNGIVDTLENSEYDFKLILVKRDTRGVDFDDFKSGKGIAGMIIVHWFEYFQGFDEIEILQIPNVVICDCSSSSGASCVHSDNEQGTRALLEYFTSCGHQRIAMVQGPDESCDAQERFEQYLEFLAQRGLAVREQWLSRGNFRPQSGYDATASILQADDRPTAILYANDAMALGGLNYCKEHGIRCPEDISIAGYDDDRLCEATTPRLTSVRQPFYEMGIEAVRILVDNVKRELQGAPMIRKLETELVVRDSVKRIS